MDLHPGETVLYQGHPSWRSTLGFYLKGLVAAVVVGAIAFVAVSLAVGIAALVVVLMVVVVLGALLRAATTYAISSERLHSRRGILSRSVQQTRLERVQDVTTEQSLLERVLQVGTVDFDTAGTDDADFRFRGIADPDEVVDAVERAQRAG